MAAFKQLLSSDVIVSPLELNKGFVLPYSEWVTGSDDQLTGLARYKGITGSFETNQDTTGPSWAEQYQVLVHSSIKELYFSNFLTSSLGIPPVSASLIPGEDSAGDALVGLTSSQGRYENYLQSSLDPARYLPPKIGVLSIPTKLYGDTITPGTWELSYVDSGGSEIVVYDDGEGRILQNGLYAGNIIYSHGIIIFTALSCSSDPNPGGAAGYGISLYGTSSFYYGDVAGLFDIDEFLSTSNITCSFSSSFTVYETQYKCTARESEYNFSLNPTIISSSDGIVYDYATSSNFSPYVTTIGLYDENQYLLAVGKLSQPYALSATTDMSFIVNIDR